MSRLSPRTTRQDRRLVLVLLRERRDPSTLAVLAMSTVFRFVLLLPAAALTDHHRLARGASARVTQRSGALAERIVLTPIIWIGLIARTFYSMSLPFAGGDSAADVGIWFLEGTWAWSGAWRRGVWREATVRARGGARTPPPPARCTAVQRGGPCRSSRLLRQSP